MLPPAPQNFNDLSFGLYQGAVANPSLAAWPSLRRSALKQWIYAGVFNADYFCGFAIADAGRVATAFAYVYEVATQTFIEKKITIPFGFGPKADFDLNSYWKLGNFTIAAQGNTLTLNFNSPNFRVNIILENNTALGTTTITRAAYRPFNHTFKNQLMPAKVEAFVNGKALSFNGNIGSIDFSKGYPPRNTFWNWASMAGTFLDDNSPVGLNLVAEHNNGLENALWVNNQAIALPQAIFSYSPPTNKTPWGIKTMDGSVDLTFTPYGARTENINALIMLSKFTQPFGKFTGTIQGRPVEGYGVVEEHLAKW